MDRLRTALIGCGKVGGIHASALDALPEADFVAACDADLWRAEALAGRFGARAFADVRTMLSEAAVQAVTICTPHPMHAEPAILAARAGVHVLVEKPMAAGLRDCDAMLAAAREAGMDIPRPQFQRQHEAAE